MDALILVLRIGFTFWDNIKFLEGWVKGSSSQVWGAPRARLVIVHAVVGARPGGPPCGTRLVL